MAVDAAVAHIERTGNIDNGSLGKSVAPQDVLGDFEDPLRRQDNGFIHASTLFPFRVHPAMELLPKRPCRSFRKALASMRQFCSLRRDVARHQQIEPMPNVASEVDDFGRHCLKSPFGRGPHPKTTSLGSESLRTSG